MKKEQKEHQRMIKEQKKRSRTKERMKEEQKEHQRMIKERKKRSRMKEK
jgi:hypothetical protein